MSFELLGGVFYRRVSNKTESKPHQYPGRFATGIIGRSYFQPGQVKQN